MRSMHGPDALLLASKKPRIKELIAKARTMSDDDIRALHEKPDVIRGLLRINEKSRENEVVARAERLADEMQRLHAHAPASNDRSCQVYRFDNADDPWIKNGASLIEIKEGWHWAQLADGTIMVTNFAMMVPASEMEKLISISTYLGMMTMGEFKDLENRRKNALSPSFILQLGQ